MSITSDEWADVWNYHFKTSWNNLSRYYDSCVMDSNEISEVLSYMTNISKNYKTPINTIFNSTNYHTYYGNLSHGIINKILSLINKGYDDELYPYLYLMFYLVDMHKLVDITTIDYYEETPHDILVNFMVKNDVYEYPQNVTEHQLTILKTLSKILEPTYCIVTCMQKYVRGWLARREYQRMKLRMVLETILCSPSEQVELLSFPAFPGGTIYHRCIENLDDTALTIHIEKVLLV